MPSMTTRDKYNFILYSFLPAIERGGMTIKTQGDGEWTLRGNDPLAVEFIESVRRQVTAVLNKPALPFNPYGGGA